MGIHTAGTEATLIKRLMEQHAWNLPVGLDSGDDILTGVTVRDYAIQGYPSTIIIDRQGKIAFNKSTDLPRDREGIMRELAAVAKAANIPWPIAKDASENEVSRTFNQLHLAIYARAIDEALRAQTDRSHR